MEIRQLFVSIPPRWLNKLDASRPGLEDAPRARRLIRSTSSTTGYLVVRDCSSRPAPRWWPLLLIRSVTYGKLACYAVFRPPGQASRGARSDRGGDGAWWSWPGGHDH